MKRKAPPSLIRLKELLHYNPKTGIFTRIEDTGRVKAGEIAGCLRPDGYIKINVDGESYLAHHLAWFYMTGEWPDEVDHEDRDRSNNRFKNLRPATRGQNNGNSHGWDKGKRKHKLPRGVYVHPGNSSRFRAQIVVNKKQLHLGCFDTIEEASRVYRRASRKHFGKFSIYHRERVRLDG